VTSQPVHADALAPNWHPGRGGATTTVEGHLNRHAAASTCRHGSTARPRLYMSLAPAEGARLVAHPGAPKGACCRARCAGGGRTLVFDGVVSDAFLQEKHPAEPCRPTVRRESIGRSPCSSVSEIEVSP